MGKINWGRVILGTIISGIALDFLEGKVTGMVLDGRMLDELRSRGQLPHFGTGTIVFFVAWGFIIGFISMCLYAGVRPRFGAGPMTAIKVAIAVWVLYGLLPHIGEAFLGIFSMDLMVKFSCLLLLWQVIATLLGAWVYKEGDVAPASNV
jgi:hypothetical protein